jgi:hypothetical protein
MALNRSTGTVTIVTGPTPSASSTSLVMPIAVHDDAFWVIPVKPGQAVTGRNLRTGQTTYSRTETGISTLLHLSDHVFWQTSNSTTELVTVGAPVVPEAVLAAIQGAHVESDGTTLRWLHSDGDYYSARSWTPGSSTITSRAFTSAKGLDALITYPYIQAPPPATDFPGTSQLQDLRSQVTIELNDDFILAATAGDYAIFTRTTKPYSPVAVYRVQLAALASPRC